MPNWCSNIIEIKGPKDKVKAIWEIASGDNERGLLDALLPMPAELKTTFDGDKLAEPVDGHTDWWDWCVSRWGTKWEISNEGLEYAEEGDSGIISGWFESAWSPPYEAMETYGHANPDVEIKLDYHEPGMSFVGQLHIENGENLVNDHVNYAEFTSETVQDAIGEDMDDIWNISEEMREWEEYARDEAADAELQAWKEEMLGDE